MTVDDLRGSSAEKDKTGILPPKYRVHNIGKFVAVGFVCGLFTVAGIPALMGACPTSATCVPSLEIVDTSVAVVQPGFELAFEDYVQSQQLEAKARAFKGNKGYAIVKDVQHPHTYRIIEGWESKQHLDAWLAQIGVPVFSQPSVKNLLVGGNLQEFTGYTHLQSTSCRNNTNGGVTIDVESSCDKVWSVVSNWSDCSWIIGCRYAVVDPQTNVRTLHYADGNTVEVALRKLDARSRELVYETLSSTGGHFTPHIGTLNVGDTGSAPHCKVLYGFSVPRTTSINTLYDDFIGNRVPGFQKLFNDQPGSL